MSYAGDYLGSWETTINGIYYASTPVSGYWNDFWRHGQAFTCQETTEAYISTFATTGQEWAFLSPWGTSDGYVYAGYTYYFLADYSQTLDAYGWVSPWYDYGRAPYLIGRYTPIHSGGNCYQLAFVKGNAFPNKETLTLNPTGGYFDNEKTHTGNKTITRNYGDAISIGSSYHPKRYGYTLGGWANSNGGAKVDNPTFTYAATASFTKYASWSPESRKFIYIPNGFKLSSSDPEGKNPIEKTEYYETTIPVGNGLEFNKDYTIYPNIRITFNQNKHFELYDTPEKTNVLREMTEGDTPIILFDTGHTENVADTTFSASWSKDINKDFENGGCSLYVPFTDYFLIDNWFDVNTVSDRYKPLQNIKVNNGLELQAEWHDVISDTLYKVPPSTFVWAEKRDLPKDNANHKLTITFKGNKTQPDEYDIATFTKDYVDRYGFTFVGWTDNGINLYKPESVLNFRGYIDKMFVNLYPVFTRFEKDSRVEIEYNDIYNYFKECSDFIGYFNLPTVDIFRDYILKDTNYYRKDKLNNYWFLINEVHQRTNGKWIVDFNGDNITYKFQNGNRLEYGAWFKSKYSEEKVSFNDVLKMPNNHTCVFKLLSDNGVPYRWDSGRFDSELNLDLVYKYTGEKSFTLEPNEFVGQTTRLDSITAEGGNAYTTAGWLLGGTDSTGKIYVVNDKIPIEKDTKFYVVWKYNSNYNKVNRYDDKHILKRSITDIVNSWKDVIYRHCERIDIPIDKEVEYKKVKKEDILNLVEKCRELISKDEYKNLKPILNNVLSNIEDSVAKNTKITDDVKFNMIKAMTNLDLFEYTQE